MSDDDKDKWGGNIEVCGADSFMLRDGVCDELTNTALCHWDGGDCCLDKSIKDTTLCQVPFKKHFIKRKEIRQQVFRSAFAIRQLTA